jgi:predicted O-methyltransferase YrrM
MIKYIAKHYKKKDLVGVEIGVLQGLNAVSIMEHLSIKRLYLVDSWCIYDGLEDCSKYKIPDSESHNENYEVTKQRMKKYGSKCVLVRKPSEDAVNDIPDNLDFIYIDANHQYEWVKKDIELYYPKLLSGGIIGGHDFRADTGVAEAVIEFTKKHGLQYSGNGVDWWVVKP